MRSPRNAQRPADGARAVVLIILLFVLVAGVLGIATGSFDPRSIRMKTPAPSDPITIP
ncbi:MAG TPA: hypothetical protein VHA07_12135 [Devosia sp.]|nr:hypothetical protein [Devosia sp.]